MSIKCAHTVECGVDIHGRLRDFESKTGGGRLLGAGSFSAKYVSIKQCDPYAGLWAKVSGGAFNRHFPVLPFQYKYGKKN